MRSLQTRLRELKALTTPFAPVHFHLIGQPAGVAQGQALVDYEAEDGPVSEDDGFIYLVGLTPGGN